MSAKVENEDGAAVRIPPPLIPLIALVVGVVLERWVWPIGWSIEGGGRFILSVVVCAAGLFPMLGAIRLFRESGQDPKPWESTPAVIEKGVYRFTRNPMYLGMGLLQAGIGVGLANAWVIVLVPVSWAVIYLIAIRHEEAYLEQKFGPAYTDYKQRVRRWI